LPIPVEADCTAAVVVVPPHIGAYTVRDVEPVPPFATTTGDVRFTVFVPDRLRPVPVATGACHDGREDAPVDVSTYPVVEKPVVAACMVPVAVVPPHMGAYAVVVWNPVPPLATVRALVNDSEAPDMDVVATNAPVMFVVPPVGARVRVPVAPTVTLPLDATPMVAVCVTSYANVAWGDVVVVTTMPEENELEGDCHVGSEDAPVDVKMYPALPIPVFADCHRPVVVVPPHMGA
jgi:hypothetical protein